MLFSNISLYWKISLVLFTNIRKLWNLFILLSIDIGKYNHHDYIFQYLWIVKWKWFLKKFREIKIPTFGDFSNNLATFYQIKNHQNTGNFACSLQEEHGFLGLTRFWGSFETLTKYQLSRKTRFLVSSCTLGEDSLYHLAFFSSFFCLSTINGWW